jgi:hypothetical protein
LGWISDWAVMLRWGTVMVRWGTVMLRWGSLSSLSAPRDQLPDIFDADAVSALHFNPPPIAWLFSHCNWPALGLRASIDPRPPLPTAIVLLPFDPGQLPLLFAHYLLVMGTHLPDGSRSDVLRDEFEELIEGAYLLSAVVEEGLVRNAIPLR